MNKQKFNSIVRSLSTDNSEDLQLLSKVADQYPYSQVIHTLLAKSLKNAGSSDTKMAIQHAAIYATDRIVLKNIIETSPKAAPIQDTASSEPSSSSASQNQEVEPVKFRNSQPILTDIDELRQGIFKNLELLQTSKKHFNTIEEGSPQTLDKKKPATVRKKKTTTKKVAVKKKAEPPKKVKPQKKKRTTSKENNTLSQKEQVDLIDKFIQSPPVISKAKSKSKEDNEQPDLSQSAVNFEEDFASENMALILAKQGNKEKAIEIYKKLIWKFPQKKAYFATQIEGLKK